MKKLTLLVFFVILILGSTVLIKSKTSNSEEHKNDKQISAVISKFSEESGHQFKLATKEIEQRIYGEWQVEGGLGYSLKYDVTGGSLEYGKLYISKELCRITTLTAVMANANGEIILTDNFEEYSKLHTTGDFEDYNTDYKSPVFAYYQETLNEMKQDDFLDDYSGIEGLDPDTVGTVVIAMGLSSDSPDNYSYITTGFIIINDYIIAVRQSSFYQLQKIEQ